MSEYLSFGAWVQRRRRALALTQEDLASRVGCSRELIKKIEGDARRPSRQVAELLAAALQLDESEREPFVRAARAELAPDRLPHPAASAPLPLLVSAAPTSEYVPAPLSTIPAPATALIGRGREVAELRALLACPGVRLVTLTGPGGAGKTRLAIQLAAELSAAGPGRFPGGIVFVDLAPLADPALVAPTVARALGLRESRAAETLLAAALSQRQMLLELDNFEQVVDAARQRLPPDEWDRAWAAGQAMDVAQAVAAAEEGPP